MSSNYVENLFISWDELHRDCRALAMKVADLQDWRGVLGVARGGMAPASIIVRELGIRNVELIQANSYHYSEQKDGVEIQAAPHSEDGGKGWLIVDDLSDTGGTFRALREIYPKACFVCPYVKPSGKVHTDHFIRETGQDVWIHFPWDIGLQYQPPIKDED